MNRNVKIAGVQMDSKILDKTTNLNKIAEMTRSAAKEGAQLIVFPECALTGYAFDDLEEAIPVTETVPGPSTEIIISLCKELNVFVIFGLLEKDGSKYYNCAAFVGPEGLIGKHRKAHLPFVGIDRFVNYGDILPTVYETKVGKIGIGICFDMIVPEYTRVLTLMEADIVVFPVAWTTGVETVPKYWVPVRAMENHIFIVAVNRVGQERKVKYFGRSKIAWWMGPFLAEGKPDIEDIMYASIDPSLARKKRETPFPGQAEVDHVYDRRIDFYRILSQPLPRDNRMR